MPNGAYLVNGTDDNGNNKSGIAWYRDLNRQNDGKQPDAYVDVHNVAPGHFIRWENQEISATFSDGNAFTVDIVADAQNQGFGGAVGSAKNNFQSYQVFKDDNRDVFEQGGYTFHTLYYCQ